MAPDQQDRYTQGGLTPLLDDGNFGLVLFFEPATGGFVEKDVERPDDVRHRYENWHQYLANQVIRMAESGVSDERLQSISSEIGFRHLAAAIQFLDRCGDLPADEFERQRQEFLTSVPD